MKKPRVFISSTIYDFKDLRSAIKYYLAESGFDVQLSEQNDFDVDVSVHSYEACLRNIESCQYFILLIGGRRGGWFDFENKISITQAEYKKAYELAKEGKIKIIPFIRKEILDIKEDRKGLKSVLETKTCSTDYTKDIMNHSSTLLQDAEFTFKFINQVGKNFETAQGERPVSNWFFSFNDFSDIIIVLKNMLSLKHDINKQIWIENIKREIARNLRISFIKIDGEVKYKNYRSVMLNKKTLDTFKTHPNEYKFTFDLTGEEIYWIGYYIFEIDEIEKYENSYMSEVLKSETFFEYDPITKRLLPDKTYLLIEKVVNKINQLSKYPKIEWEKRIEFADRYKNLDFTEKKKTYTVEGTLIFQVATIANLIDDITHLQIELLNTISDPNYQIKYEEKIEYSIRKTTNKGIKESSISFDESLIMVNKIIDGEMKILMDTDGACKN